MIGPLPCSNKRRSTRPLGIVSTGSGFGIIFDVLVLKILSFLICVGLLDFRKFLIALLLVLIALLGGFGFRGVKLTVFGRVLIFLGVIILWVKVCFCLLRCDLDGWLTACFGFDAPFVSLYLGGAGSVIFIILGAGAFGLVTFWTVFTFAGGYL